MQETAGSSIFENEFCVVVVVFIVIVVVVDVVVIVGFSSVLSSVLSSVSSFNIVVQKMRMTRRKRERISMMTSLATASY